VAKVRVYWTEHALGALESIGDYIAEDAPERAIDFTTRLLESTFHLEDFPFSGSTCPEDASCRHVILSGYRIIYEVTDTGVKVLTVISPGKNVLQFK
jgi:addiction module RelE/StbE family toxin